MPTQAAWMLSLRQHPLAQQGLLLLVRSWSWVQPWLFPSRKPLQCSRTARSSNEDSEESWKVARSGCT
jgi:hypothetical protein